MGRCGCCLQATGAALAALLAVLVLLHMECAKERAEDRQAKSNDQVFDPTTTDVVDVPLSFNPGEVMTFKTQLLLAFLPCCMQKLLHLVTGGDMSATKQGFMWAQVQRKSDGEDLVKDLHHVTIHDARKRPPGSFHQTGFTLIDLEEKVETDDWRTPAHTDEEADIRRFHRQIEPHLRTLYPAVKRFLWTINIVRGGDRLFDQPIALTWPHLDYHQNSTARRLYHDEFPACADFSKLPCEGEIMMGLDDKDDAKFGVLLGVWKPIHPVKQVCDYPLAVMDARTFRPENHHLNEVHYYLGPAAFNILGGAVSHSLEQDWSYFPFQTTQEVLVFHQFSKERFFANPHTSFHNSNCPEGMPGRVSVEMRVALYF